MSTYGERLTKARQYRGLNQKQLADATGITKSAINQTESGLTKGLRHDNHLRACSALGIRPEWLSMSKEPMLVYQAKESGLAYHSNVNPGRGVLGRVPLISWVQAGEFREAVDPYVLGGAEEWVAASDPLSSTAYALRVRGASMEPAFFEGEKIIIDPKVDYVPGDYVIARRLSDNFVTLKKLGLEGDTYFLRAINPDWPEPILKINQDWQVCGVVISKVVSYR